MNTITAQGLLDYIDNVEIIVEELNPDVHEGIGASGLSEVIEHVASVAYYMGVDQFEIAQSVVLAHAGEIQEIPEIQFASFDTPQEAAAFLTSLGEEDELATDGSNPVDIAKDVLGDSSER